jgi:hypothetical protein
VLQGEESAKATRKGLRFGSKNLAEGGNLCVLLSGCHIVYLSCLDNLGDRDPHSGFEMDDPNLCLNFFGAGSKWGENLIRSSTLITLAESRQAHT